MGGRFIFGSLIKLTTKSHAKLHSYNIPGDQLACSWHTNKHVSFFLESPSTIKGKQLFCITVLQYLAFMLCWETMLLQGFWRIPNNRKISPTAPRHPVERTTPQHRNRCFPLVLAVCHCDRRARRRGPQSPSAVTYRPGCSETFILPMFLKGFE